MWHFMNKTKLILLLTTLVFGCSSGHDGESNPTVLTSDSLKNQITNTSSHKLNYNIKYYIKDTSQYSQTSLNDLYNICKIDQQLIYVSIINDKLTCIRKKKASDGATYFDATVETIPTALPLSKTVYYNAIDKGKSYRLGLTRNNYTDIEYDLKVNDSTKFKGIAAIGLCVFTDIITRAVFPVPDRIGIYDSYDMYIEKTNSDKNNKNFKSSKCRAIHLNVDDSKAAIIEYSLFNYSPILMKE